jgi:hypothetical protein
VVAQVVTYRLRSLVFNKVVPVAQSTDNYCFNPVNRTRSLPGLRVPTTTADPLTQKMVAEALQVAFSEAIYLLALEETILWQSPVVVVVPVEVQQTITDWPEPVAV